MGVHSLPLAASPGEAFFSVIEFEIKRTGLIIILSAPSGGGKSTILRALLKADSSLSYSVSATTRKPRHDEQHGREYYFMDLPEFRAIEDRGGFYESFVVHGNNYGTLRAEVDAKLEAGLDVLMDVDVQGSLRIKQLAPDCTSIFVLPPSMATLERRLRSRGTDRDEDIRRRLDNARDEVRLAGSYDYILVNDELDKTIENVRTIIHAQRFRSSRVLLRDGLGEVVAAAGRSEKT